MNLEKQKPEEEGETAMGTFYVGHAENRSLLEISRCIGSIKNRKRIKSFDIASLTGQDETPPGSPEIDVITITTKAPEPEAKRPKKDQIDDAATHRPFRPFQDHTIGQKDSVSAFRKVDKLHSLSPTRMVNNGDNNKVMLTNYSFATAMTLTQERMPPLSGPFPDDRMLKISETKVSAEPILSSNIPIGRMYMKADPLQAVKSSYSLLPFMPPSLAALSFPTQNWCAKCNASFRMTSDLVYHMRSHHKREKDPMKLKREDKLRCDICHETFRERHHLTRHMTSHQ